MELKVNDGGTWRNIVELKVNDGGTWRTIQDVKVNDGGTWRTVYQAFSPLSAVLVSDTYGGGFVTGYAKVSGGVSTCTPNVFASGHSLDNFDQAPGGLKLVISGFSADPGQLGWFTTATYDGTPKTAASASGYSYSSGVAQWSWGVGVSFANGVSKTFTIT